MLGCSDVMTSSITRPGATALTRMPCGPSSIAITSVIMFTAALVLA